MPYCFTCDRPCKSLGISRHRQGHLDRGEARTIELLSGTCTYHPRPEKPLPDTDEEERSDN